MRPFFTILAAAVVVGVTAGTASAQYGQGYRGFVEYRGYHEYSGGQVYGGYPTHGYGRGQFGWVPSYGHSYGYGSGLETHGQAVRRIMATYSRDRYYTHPRSPYNEPTRYRRYGW